MAVTNAGGRGRTAKSAAANARPLIIVHGVLLSQEMNRPLAKDLAAKGEITLRVAATFPPEHARAAHERLMAGGVRGRLLISF